MRNKYVLIAALLFFFGLTVYLQRYEKKLEQGVSVNSMQADKSTSTALARRFLNDKSKVIKDPFLFSDILQDVDVLVIDSPEFAVSKNEAKFIQSFVASGGQLLLSSLQKKHQYNLTYVFDALNIERKSFESEEYKDFKNKALVNVKSPITNESIQFYSIFYFKDETCSGTKELLQKCFMKHFKYGAGSVVYTLGLPAYANVFLNNTENQNILFDLDKYKSIAWDEYHHFFTQKSIKDLLLDFQFSLPIVLFILCILIFLALLPKENEAQESQMDEKHLPSYHLFYQDLLKNVMQEKFNEKQYQSNLLSYVKKLQNANKANDIKTNQDDVFDQGSELLNAIKSFQKQYPYKVEKKNVGK